MLREAVSVQVPLNLYATTGELGCMCISSLGRPGVLIVSGLDLTATACFLTQTINRPLGPEFK